MRHFQRLSTRSIGELYSETAVPSGEDRQCQGRDRVRQRALTVIWFLGVGVPRQNLVHSQNECLGDGLDASVSIKILAMLWAIITSLRNLLGWVVSAFSSREVALPSLP